MCTLHAAWKVWPSGVCTVPVQTPDAVRNLHHLGTSPRLEPGSTVSAPCAKLALDQLTGQMSDMGQSIGWIRSTYPSPPPHAVSSTPCTCNTCPGACTAHSMSGAGTTWFTARIGAESSIWGENSRVALRAVCILGPASLPPAACCLLDLAHGLYF